MLGSGFCWSLGGAGLEAELSAVLVVYNLDWDGIWAD
jgi:hypothetical protein